VVNEDEVAPEKAMRFPSGDHVECGDVR